MWGMLWFGEQADRSRDRFDECLGLESNSFQVFDFIGTNLLRKEFSPASRSRISLSEDNIYKAFHADILSGD